MAFEYIIFVLLGFFASIISAVFGFGTALVVIALGSHILPVKETIALATVLFASTTITKSLLFTRHIDWNMVAIMSAASLPLAYLGAQLMVIVPAEIIKQLVGVMVLVYVAMTRYGLFPKISMGTTGLIFGSAGYGFLSGLLGSGNLIKAILFSEMNITREAFVGAMAATSVLANLAKLTSYTSSGLITMSLMWPILGLVMAGAAASLMGRRILKNITAVQFERCVHLVMVISALGLLL